MKSNHKAIFPYHLPNGGLNTVTYFTPDNKIKFDPPVYEQRYTTTVRIIEDPCWEKPLKKIVDFGCAEMRLLPLLRRIPSAEHILEVDVDETLLKKFQNRAVPLAADYLLKRETPLRIEILHGSIIEPVENIRNVDVVIGLEIIEHLTLDILDNVPKNVFGFMKPKLAIFSTPNAEFNVLFQPLLPNGFRHDDHKFEWTRMQFRTWALNICERFPNYKVSFLGLGPPPTNHKHLGHATQMAIFAHADLLPEFISLGKEIEQQKQQQQQTQLQQQQSAAEEPQWYKKIYVVDYPYQPDTRTLEQKITDEIRYFINRFRYAPLYFNRERSIYQLPIDTLIEFTIKSGGNKEFLMNACMENDIEVVNDFIILPEYDEYECDSEEENSDYNCTSDDTPDLKGTPNDDMEENWNTSD